MARAYFGLAIQRAEPSEVLRAARPILQHLFVLAIPTEECLVGLAVDQLCTGFGEDTVVLIRLEH